MHKTENQYMENGKALSFLDIISHHKIEIPVIQRDYAQGRISNRITPIRKKFIQELVNTIKNDDAEPMHLDFVYGRIEGKNQKLVFAKNKEAIENILLAVKGYADQCNIEFDPKIKVPETINDTTNSNFIPLDGQQRLTTLYLLHWYLLKSIQIENKTEFLKYLSGFSYKTRNSTKEFCKFLIDLNTSIANNSDVSIAAIIEESPAFYTIWKRDPSVQGMLTTLHEIQLLLKMHDEKSLVDFWNNLTTKRKLTFDFLDLDEYEQIDELYVKMNARGKQLTDFEHFKSWLHEHIKYKSIKISENKWSDNIDTKWLDLFWKNKQDNSYEVDPVIYNFIKSINLYEYVATTNKEPSSKEIPNEKIINKELINKIRETNVDKNFISITEYEDSRFFNKESIDFTFSCLNQLTNIDLDACHKVIENVTQFPFMGTQSRMAKLPFTFLSDNLNPSLPDRVFYFAFLLFVTDSSIEISEEKTKDQLRKWIRICRNLIYNTYIQNPDNFIDAIKAMKEFSIHMYRIEEAIIEEGFSVKFFEGQLKEEIIKIKYFGKGDNWKKQIVKTENHTYFYGQIGFMFKLLDDADDFGQFDYYSNKLSKIFNNIENDNFLFHRLLLSKGDYLIQSNSKYSFCESNAGSLRSRQDNWRKIFNDEKKLETLKSVLVDSLEMNISNESLNDYSKKNWESFFIKEKYTNNLTYLNEQLIDWQEEWDIKLLDQSTYKGKHADLYSHSLYLDLKTERFDVKYVSVNGRRTENNKPKIEFKTHSDLMNITYEPNFSSEECSFIVEFNSTQFNDVEGFEIFENKLIYKMEKKSVAEGYNNVLSTITKLLKSIRV